MPAEKPCAAKAGGIAAICVRTRFEFVNISGIAEVFEVEEHYVQSPVITGRAQGKAVVQFTLVSACEDEGTCSVRPRLSAFD